MNTIQDLINKLNSLKWVQVDGKTLISANGWKVSYSIKFLTSPPHREDYPVQVVIQIRKNNQYVMTWGCEDNESNRAFVNFYEVAKSNAYKNEMDINDLLQKEYKELFEKL
jgi:hypothetical protein